MTGTDVQFEPGDRRRVLPRHLRPTAAPDTFSFDIRPAESADLPHIREIYDHFVRNSVVTLDAHTRGIPHWRDKFALLSRLRLPFLVAVSPSGSVLGFALAQPWAGGNAYRYTVEDSIYLGPGAGGKGLGTALLEALIDACEQLGIREMVAVISDSQADASVRLHARLGFVEAGRTGRVAHRFGRDIGTVYMKRRLRGAKGRRLFGSGR